MSRFTWTPAVAGEFALKQQLDELQDAADSLDTAGTTVVGSHTHSTTDVTDLASVPLSELAPAVDDINLNSNAIVNLATPSDPTDAANKAYVDSVATGLSVKQAVLVATTANITLSGEQTIDDVAVVAGDRVLVKDQSTASQNGIYVVASGAWSRAGDADADAEVTNGMFTLVTSGTVNQARGYVLITPNPITVGTTGLTFTQFSGGGGASLTVFDEGVALPGSASELDFVGNAVSVIGTGSTKTINITGGAANLPWVSLDDYAVGNGTTDDAQGIRNAIAALPSAGGIVRLGPGKYYRINSQVDCSAKDGIIFQGGALPFWNSSAATSPSNTGSKFVIANGITGFLNDGGGTTSIDQRGIAFEYVGFETVNPSLRTGIGIKLDRTNRWRLSRCHFKGFGSAVQIDSHVTGDSPNNDNAWSHMEDCHFLQNAKSVETIHTYGFSIFGGSINNGNDTDTGLSLLMGEHVRVFGMKFDNGIGIDYRCGNGLRVFGCSFEACKIGFRIGTDQRFGFTDPSQNAWSRFWTLNGNFFVRDAASLSTGIYLDTYAYAGTLVGNYFSAITTRLTDVSKGQHVWYGMLPSSALMGMNLPNIGTLPATGTIGDYYNVNGVLKTHNGSAFISVGAQT